MEQEEEEEAAAPPLFRCPISMELMEDPVTISTGVTYERKNIHKWLFTYHRLTCPATMQLLSSFDLTPNLTLLRLISSWRHHKLHSPPPPPPPLASVDIETDKLTTLLSTLTSSPFKVSPLKSLHSLLLTSLSARTNFVALKGIPVLTQIMIEYATDFTAFRACEEAIGALHLLPLSDLPSVEHLAKPEHVKPVLAVLQRGSAEARLHALTLLQKISRANEDWTADQELDLFKPLLELLSDEISTELSSSSLDVLVEVVSASKKNRVRAIEAGAVCTLVELLPDSSRRKCEQILLLIRRLCECPEGRSAFADHGLGVAAVSKKVLRVSETATKLGVKILWLVCNFMPTEKVVDDMMAFGAVGKLLGLLHIEGRSSTKERALKLIRLHGGWWRKYACFPCELRDYLRPVHGTS